MIRVLGFLLFASVVIAEREDTTKDETIASSRSSTTWNSFLGTENVIPDYKDNHRNESSDVMRDLKILLSDANLRSEVWTNFKIQYKKDCDGAPCHEQLFFDNLYKVAEHNLKYEEGSETWKQGVNQFTDLTDKEFMSMFTGSVVVPPISNLSDLSSLSSKNNLLYQPTIQTLIPESMDLRVKNIITPVKDQGTCRSCTLFTVTGMTEAAIAKKTGILLDLSEQELVDCITGTQTKSGSGCNGNWYEPPFDYIQKNGLVAEKDYKYQGNNNYCRRNKRVAAGRIIRYTRINPAGNEGAQKNAMQSGEQPVAVIVAVSKEWSSYKAGVYTGSCGDQNGLHAVQMVGYGKEGGTDYWLIKNSWGKLWGDQGYIKHKRGSNKCGVADYGYTVAV